jgi:hypothetical protein
MTDSDVNTASDRLGHAHDELGRAHMLLSAASIIVDHMYRRDLSKAEMDTLDSIGTCLNSVDDILEAVQRALAEVLAGHEGKAGQA